MKSCPDVFVCRHCKNTLQALSFDTASPNLDNIDLWMYQVRKVRATKSVQGEVFLIHNVSLKAKQSLGHLGLSNITQATDFLRHLPMSLNDRSSQLYVHRKLQNQTHLRNGQV